LPPSAPETVALVVAWFVLGFAFYSVAYAALGALVSRQEDLEATTAPVNVLLIGAYLGANAAIQDPDGTWAQIASFLPPLSPLIVPTRVVLGDMGAIGLLATVAIEVLATFLLIRLAAGIYERSILRIGAPISLRSAVATRRAATARPHPHTAPCAAGHRRQRASRRRHRRHGQPARNHPRRYRSAPSCPLPIPPPPPAHAARIRPRLGLPRRQRGPAARTGRR
jgi:ABC-2 family transporter protein